MMVDYDGLQHDLQSELERSERRMLAELQQAMQDGEVTRCHLPYEWSICDTCRGEGGHSRRLGVISSEDWSEWDDDERHSYLSGRYDATCDRCGGSGKVRELQVESLPSDVLAWIEGYENDAYEAAMTTYYERRAGC
jgi:hypothetical protein